MTDPTIAAAAARGTTTPDASVDEPERYDSVPADPDDPYRSLDPATELTADERADAAADRLMVRRADERVRRAVRRRLLLLGGVIAAVAVTGSAAYSAVQARIGSPEDALAAIPDDAAIVITVDLLHFAEEGRLDPVIAVVEDFAVWVDPGTEPVDDDPLAELDSMLEENLGVDFTDDILPWVGRSVALSLDDPEETMGTTLEALESEGPEGVVLAVSVRDEGGATAFVEKLAAANGADVERVGVAADTDAYVIGGEDRRVWVLVESGLLVVASDEATLEKSVATMQSGDGMAGDAEYRAVVDELPGDRGLHVFVDGDETFGNGRMNQYPDMAISAGLTDLGVAVDVVSDVGAPPGGILPPPLGADLPADTLLYLGFGVDASPVGDILRESDPATYEEMELLGEEFLGIDSVGVLVDHLTAQFGLVVTPLQGEIPMAGGMPFNVSAILSVGIDDPAAVTRVASDVVDGLATLGTTVEESDGVWQLMIEPEAPPALVWTVTDDSLRIATDLGILERFAPGEDGDEQAAAGDDPENAPEDYAELDAALPGEGLNYYNDIHGFAASIFGDAETSEALTGLEGLAAGIEQRGTLLHLGLVLRLADPDEDGVGALGR